MAAVLHASPPEKDRSDFPRGLFALDAVLNPGTDGKLRLPLSGVIVPVPAKEGSRHDGLMKMAKLRKRRLRWNHPSAPRVARYRVYWKIGQGVDYDSDYEEVEKTTEVTLPDDIPSFPLIEGRIELGVTAVDDAGSESDMAKLTAPFEFIAPDAPTNLVVEALKEFHFYEPDANT